MTLEQHIKNLTAPTKKIDVVLDTDAYNEVDDQFAISYMLCYRDKLNVKGFCAAPFFNQLSSSPADGMEKSYNELFNLIKLAGETDLLDRIYRGSTTYLPDEKTPVESEAADFMATLANNYSPENPLYIVAIGAITNVASAILKNPKMAENTVIVWLGGHATHVLQERPEFNLRGDIAAAQVVFDSGIDLVQIPCRGVCSEMSTTWHELEYYLRGRNEICDYLTDIVREASQNSSEPYAKSRVIWDVSAGTVLLCPEAFEMEERPCPVIGDDGFYEQDDSRHSYLYVHRLYRDRFFADLFRSLTGEF